MTRQEEVISKLCEICSFIGDNVYHNDYAHDCICQHADDSSFQFDDIILDFIEESVRQRINRVYR